MSEEEVTAAEGAPATDNPRGLGAKEPKHQFGLSAAKSARLERKALTKGYPIRDEFLGPMVNRQIAVAMDPDAGSEESPDVPGQRKRKPPTVRDQTRAFLAVMAARRQNLEIEAVERGEPLPVEPAPGAMPLPAGQIKVLRRQVITEVMATYDFTQPADAVGHTGHVDGNGHADAGANGREIEQGTVANGTPPCPPGPHFNGAGPRPA